MPDDKHTPGPWTATVRVDHRDGTGENFLLEANGQTIIGGCGCCDSPYMGVNAAADSRLIAAAPELLEALAGLFGAAGEVSEFLADEDYPRTQAILDGYLIAARAAIAKARGEA